jgi:uncharacterized SAM-binding protein YcdF (DUF218 family)
MVLALLVAALWLWRRPGSIAARRFLIASAMAYTAASVYVVPAAVGRLLTSAYHPFEAGDVPRGPTAVVLLGSGDQTIQGWDATPLSVLDPVGASRVLEAWRVFRLIDPAWIISSGGSPDPASPHEPSSIVMRDALVALGVPGGRIKLESLSTNTHDEAVLLSPVLHSLDIEQLVIVTSDVHMRRSLGIFRAQGWNAIPAIAPDPDATLTRAERWRPSLPGLWLSGRVAHELLGIPYYWARGWYR